MFGFLNLHKPTNWTSRDVVNVVQKLVRPVKAGHAGTLDPLATGVLVVGLGQATRLVEFVQQLPKQYVGEFQLGRQSDSEDITTPVTECVNAPCPTLAEIVSILPRFLGTIQQVPPAFSALKVQGRRAYDLARRGEVVELAARPVVIHALQIVAYDYPRLVLGVTCGSGTYIRSLGRDIAQALGTAAVMSGLVRTSIGPFLLGEAIAPERLSREMIDRHLISSQQGVLHLPQRRLTATETIQVGQGKSLRDANYPTDSEIAATDPTNRLIAILRSDGTQLRPIRVFPADDSAA